MKLSAALFSIVAMSAGCTKAIPPPNDSLASAVDLVHSAWTLGVERDSAAEDRMRRAHSEIDRAIGLMHEGKNEEATRLLARANVDAELALELGRENKMQRRARDAETVVEAARQGQ